MAETVTIDGQPYLKRNPLGVLGLSFITLGIYGLYWYYKVNEEIQRFTRDETISPSRSLVAVIPAGSSSFRRSSPTTTPVEPHRQMAEQRRGPESQISPALRRRSSSLVISIGMAAYVQEHLNRSGTPGRWPRARPASRPAGGASAASAARRLAAGAGQVRSSIGTQRWSRGPMYSESGRITRLSAYCSRTCAVHPAIRAIAKIGVMRSVGMPSVW